MSILGAIVFFGWIPVIFVIFLVMPPRRAAVASLVAGWLVIPPVRIIIPGIPDYTKVSATLLGILLATAVFDARRIFALRLRWYDLPILCYCVAPFCASMSNGLGAYDGLSESLEVVVFWGFSYSIGRMYFTGLDGLRDLAVGMVAGGLAYVPPCLFELRFSPHLMQDLYGVGNWENGMRFGVFRPRVFLGSGLELGMWMGATGMVAFALWLGGAARYVWRVPVGWAAATLVATTVLCRSSGSIILMALGVVLLYAATRGKGRSWPVLLVLSAAPFYMVTRTTGLWSGEQAVELASASLGPERAESLEFRMVNEDTLMAHALLQPVFGWGGWGRMNAYCARYSMTTITDGLWIIVLGMTGLFGLASLTTALLLPSALLVRRFPTSRWREPEVIAAVALAILVDVWMIDNLANAMINPIYPIAAGGLMGLMPGRRGASKAAPAEGPAELAPGPGGDPLAEGLAARAERFAVLGRTEEAEEAHRLALGRLSEVADRPGGRRDLAAAHERFGRFLGELGRQAEAEASWQSAIGLRRALADESPDVPAHRREWAEAQNNLAWALANAPDPSHREPARAVRLAAEAVEVDPDHGGFWNTLGAAHYRDGNWDAAVAALEKSSRIGPNAYTSFFLAMAHARRSDPARARDYFTQGTALAGRDAPGHAGLARLRAEAVETIGAP